MRHFIKEKKTAYVVHKESLPHDINKIEIIWNKKKSQLSSQVSLMLIELSQNMSRVAFAMFANAIIKGSTF